MPLPNDPNVAAAEALRQAIPSRASSGADLERWNQAWRASPLNAHLREVVGAKPGQPLTDRQRQNILANLRSVYGVQVPNGMIIDPAGNLNQKNLLWENVLKTVAIGAATGGTAGAAGAFGGAAGGAGGAAGTGAAGAGAGSAGAAGTGGLLASSSLPAAGLIGGPAAITSGGVSAGLGAGALGAGAGGGGLLASSSIPTASLMGGAPAITSGGVSGGLSAGAAGSGLLASSAGPSVTGAPPAITAQGVSATGGGGSGALGWIRNNPDLVDAAGRGLGAVSQAQAQNRGAEFAGQYDLERLLIERDEENRAGQQDAWRKLLAAQRTLSPRQQPTVSPYAVAPRQATDVERQGAEALSASSLGRLQGGPRPVSVDPRLLRPGGAEQTLGWLSPVLTGIGAYYGRR